MAKTPKLITASGEEYRAALPKVEAVHPYGSKILVSILRADELMGGNLIVSEKTQMDGAPQAYIIEIGPSVPKDSGLEVGQRIYWTGRGTEVKDPREDKGRVRAMLEISNVLAILDEAN